MLTLLLAPLTAALVDRLTGGTGDLPLEEVLGDPIVRALMRSDGVEAGEVRRVLEVARRRRPPG